MLLALLILVLIKFNVLELHHWLSNVFNVNLMKNNVDKNQNGLEKFDVIRNQGRHETFNS